MAFGLSQSLKVEFPRAPPYFTQYGGVNVLGSPGAGKLPAGKYRELTLLR
jgi:hypothetical protein